MQHFRFLSIKLNFLREIESAGSLLHASLGVEFIDNGCRLCMAYGLDLRLPDDKSWFGVGRDRPFQRGVVRGPRR